MTTFESPQQADMAVFPCFSVMLLRVQHTFFFLRTEKNSPTVLFFLMFDLLSFFTCLVRTSDSGYNVVEHCIIYDVYVLDQALFLD